MHRRKKFRSRRQRKVEEKGAQATEEKKKPSTCDKAVQASSIMVLIPFNLLKNVPVEVMKKHSALYNRKMVKAGDTVTTAKHLLPIAPAPTRRDSVAVSAAAVTRKVTTTQELDIQSILDMIQKLSVEKKIHLKEHLEKLQDADYIPTYVIDSDSDVEIITEAYKSSESNKKTIADRLQSMKIDLDVAPATVKTDPEEMETLTEPDASENKKKTKETAEAQLSHLPPKLRCKNARADSSSSSSSESSCSSDEVSVKSSRSPAYSPLTALLESPRSCVESPSAPDSPAGSCAGSPTAPLSPAGCCAGSPSALTSQPGSRALSPKASGSRVESPKALVSPPGAQPAHSPQLFDESTSVSPMGLLPKMFEDERRSHLPRQQSPQLRSPPPPPPLPSYTFCSAAALPAPTGYKIPRSKLLDYRRCSVPAFRPPADILSNYAPTSQSPNLSLPKPPLAHQPPASPLPKNLQTTDNLPAATSPHADNLCVRKSPSNNAPMGLAHQPPTKNMLSKYLRAKHPPATSALMNYSQANNPPATSSALMNYSQANHPPATSSALMNYSQANHPPATSSALMNYSQANHPSETPIAMKIPDEYPFTFTHPRQESFLYPPSPAFNVHQRPPTRYNLRRASIDCHADELQSDAYAPIASQMRDSWMTEKQAAVNRVFNLNAPREVQESQRPSPCTSVPPPIHFSYHQNVRAANMGPPNAGFANMGPPRNIGPPNAGYANMGPPRNIGPPNAGYASLGPPSMRLMIPHHNQYGGLQRHPPPPPQSPYYMPRDT